MIARVFPRRTTETPTMNLTDYYMTAKLHEPPMMHQHEFGVMKAGKRMWRHLSFPNLQKLRAFLIEHKPIHVYFSAARYKDPAHPIMADKGWLGADLIFDIDYDALKEPNLGEAAYQIGELDKILRDKFGLRDLTMTFSGSRGYHIHARDNCIQNLNRNERGQIADYVMGRGIEIDAPVTCDTSRLIRLPGSIHGKTGQECRIIRCGGD